VEFGQAGGSVDGAAAQVLAGSFGPLVVGAIGQVPAIGGGCALQRGDDGSVVGGDGGIGQGSLEAPQVAVDEGGAGLVTLADAVDDAGLLDPDRSTEGGAQVAEDSAEAEDVPVVVELR